MRILSAILLAALCACAQAQTRHDPLNSREVDQLRDSAQQPDKRIGLLVTFAGERMLAVERLRSATKPSPADPDKIENLLTDLAALVDELDDNLAMYNQHSEDLRRPLRHVLDTEDDLLMKLKALDDLATPLQKRRFAAALEDASDSLRSSRESAQAMLADQITKKGEEKNEQKNKGKSGNKKAPQTPGSAQE